MEKIYKEFLVSEQSWPKADLKFISTDSINIVIQVNGKKKLVLEIPKDLTVEETRVLIMKKEKDFKEIIETIKLKKVIIVPNKSLA